MDESPAAGTRSQRKKMSQEEDGVGKTKNTIVEEIDCESSEEYFEEFLVEISKDPVGE
jgi:hypothetical protein